MNKIFLIISISLFSCESNNVDVSKINQNNSDTINIGDSLILLHNRQTGIEIYKAKNFPSNFEKRYSYYPDENFVDYQINSYGIGIRTNYNRIIYINLSDKSMISPVDTMIKYYAKDKKWIDTMRFELNENKVNIHLTYISSRNTTNMISKVIDLY